MKAHDVRFNDGGERNCQNEMNCLIWNSSWKKGGIYSTKTKESLFPYQVWISNETELTSALPSFFLVIDEIRKEISVFLVCVDVLDQLSSLLVEPPREEFLLVQMVFEVDQLLLVSCDHVHFVVQNGVQVLHVIVNVGSRLIDFMEQLHFLLHDVHHVVNVSPVATHHFLFFVQNDSNQLLVSLTHHLKVLLGSRVPVLYLLHRQLV